MIKKYIAFTLSEVLLVAGIAAVVGAMTIPGMQKSYTRKANMAKANAAYAKLDAGFQRINIPEVLRNKSTKSDWSKAVMDELARNVKLRVNCGKQQSNNYCFTKSDITDPSGDLSSSAAKAVIKSSNCSSAILSDGTEFIICMIYNTPTSIHNNRTTDYYGMVIVDVDGAQKGPTTRNQDIFKYYIDGTGLSVPTEAGDS